MNLSLFLTIFLLNFILWHLWKRGGSLTETEQGTENGMKGRRGGLSQYFHPTAYSLLLVAIADVLLIDLAMPPVRTAAILILFLISATRVAAGFTNAVEGGLDRIDWFFVTSVGLTTVALSIGM